MHWTRGREDMAATQSRRRCWEGVTQRGRTAGHTDAQTKVLWYLLSSVEVERGESENVITREKGQRSYKESHIKLKEALTFSLQDRLRA